MTTVPKGAKQPADHKKPATDKFVWNHDGEQIEFERPMSAMPQMLAMEAAENPAAIPELFRYMAGEDVYRNQIRFLGAEGVKSLTEDFFKAADLGEG